MEAFISKQIIKNGIIREKDELTRPNLVTEKLKSAMAVYGPEISAAALFGLCSFLYSTTSIYLSVYKGSRAAGTAEMAGISASLADYYIREAAAMLGFLLFALTGEWIKDPDRRRSRIISGNRSCSRIMSSRVMTAAAVMIYEAGLFCSLQSAGRSLLLPACVCIAAAGYLMGQVCLTAASLLRESRFRGRAISIGVITAYTVQFLLNSQLLSGRSMLLILAAGMPVIFYLIKRTEINSAADSDVFDAVTANTLTAGTVQTGTDEYNTGEVSAEKTVMAEMDNGGGEKVTAQSSPRQECIFISLLTAVFVFLLCYYDMRAAELPESGLAVIYDGPGMFILAGAAAAGYAADRKNGQMLPLITALFSFTMVLSPFSIRTDSAGSLVAGICLFYFFLGAVMVFYYASFWKLACSSAHPSFLAVQGRVIEKAVTIGSLLLLSMPMAPVRISAIHLGAVAVSIILSVVWLVRNIRTTELRQQEIAVQAGGEKSAVQNGQQSIDQAGSEAAVLQENNHTAELTGKNEASSKKDPMELFCEKYALTKREREVLERLLISDESVQEMADALFISKRMLQRHTEALYDKTGRKTRIGLINLYYRGEEKDQSSP